MHYTKKRVIGISTKKAEEWLKKGLEHGYSLGSLKKVLIKNGFKEEVVDSIAKGPLNNQKDKTDIFIAKKPKKTKKQQTDERGQHPQEQKESLENDFLKQKNAFKGLSFEELIKARSPSAKKSMALPLIISIIAFLILTLLNFSFSAASISLDLKNLASLYILVGFSSFIIGLATIMLIKRTAKDIKKTRVFSFLISISSVIFLIIVFIIQKIMAVIQYLIIVAIILSLFNIPLLFNRKKRITIFKI